ncbi:N-acetylglucosamine 6-phosphate deacetylase [Jatrophihabitans endophyticus]|uniref:N-acetylglucosamine 6-phosphate deacetylase n=1 Tax=Jatrophihabitans endophyticus TaxID=1206085 RepID=A0A1M5HE26_9ACTN|nr:N-acetylglucosamine-6-phosphate deacetylase [Jatrophihabitans endophyticus]SHG14171.1 N-acetylglucosamine 6-phosphate deacetylase [Jatrophihabitans endophyticus]
MTVLAGARVVTPDAVLDPGWVAVEGTRIAAVGAGAPPAAAADLGGAWVLPGFVDLHVHGGGGHDVTTSPRDLAAAVAFHRAHGTTRTLVSLVTAPEAELREQLTWVAAAAAAGPHGAGHVVGAHLEGPFLAAERCGAQNPAHLLAPDRAVLARLLGAAPGTVRVVTLAPELPGAADLLADLLVAGVAVAVGHTASGYDDAAAAFESGAGLATHLGNGMPPLQAREPGPVGAALDRGAYAEVINDGQHVHRGLLRLVRPDRLVLITDAMSAAGAAGGSYTLGGQEVTVAGGVARLARNGSLAGSTLTMDDAVRRAVRDAGLSIVDVAAAAATNPARVLGMADTCGALAAGLDADLVVLDDDLRLARVMAQGQWCG